jgi:hypothetical protein
MSKTNETIINLPRMAREKINITLIGETPLIVHRFAEKAKREMLEKQTKSAQKGKAAKNPEADFEASIYRMADGSHGFPAVAFKAAAVTACTSLAGITKVAARQAFHVSGQQSIRQGAFSAAITTEELVQVHCPAPTMREDMVRVGMGTSDIRYRAQYWPWAVDLIVEFNPLAMSAEQVLNLFNTAGFACGVGEWRPERDGSNGRFRVAEASDDALLIEIQKAR